MRDDLSLGAVIGGPVPVRALLMDEAEAAKPPEVTLRKIDAVTPTGMPSVVFLFRKPPRGEVQDALTAKAEALTGVPVDVEGIAKALRRLFPESELESDEDNETDAPKV